jgi:hypothetical protein
LSSQGDPEQILGGGAVRVFGDVGEKLPSRAAWNDPIGWKREFGAILPAGEIFAESFLGDQYVVVEELVSRWDPETGEAEPTGLSLSAWIERVRSDAADQQPVWLLEAWEQANGGLPVTHHLAPKVPFVLGGEFEVDNLCSVDAASDLAWRAQLALQIRDLPDGAEVKLHVRWEAWAPRTAGGRDWT